MIRFREPDTGSAILVMSELRQNDCDRLASLHREALPDSLVSELGLGYTRSFYRYLNASAHERVFVVRDGAGRVISACVLSLQRKTLHRRLLFRTPLVWHAGGWLLRKLFRKSTGAHTKTPAIADPVPDEMPELILIFTAPAARGHGAGAGLLRQCESFLSARNSSAYAVRTVDDPANRALQFYLQNGFVVCGQSTDHGRVFRVFRKALSQKESAVRRVESSHE